MGPAVLNLVQSTKEFEFLADVSMIFIMFLIGMQTKLKKLIAGSKKFIIIAFLGCFFPLGCGIIVSRLYSSDPSINLFFGLALMISSVCVTIDSLIEFGELEGISMFKEFFYVVIPMIYSTITVFLVTGIAGIFTNQLALYNFYAGGAIVPAQTIGYHYYVMVLGEDGSVMADYPYASASGLLFTLVVAPITLIGRHLLEKYGPNVEF